MHKLFGALVLLFPLSALAEEAPKEVLKQYTIVLSGPEIAVIGNALASQPYAQVATLLPKLQEQLSKQDKVQDKKDK